LQLLKLNIITLLLLFTSAEVKALVANDTIKLYFSLDKAELERESRALLDSLAYVDAISHKDKITIVGYADYLGDTAYNIKLSQQRANKVHSYLLDLGIERRNIATCVGKGEVRRNITGNKGHAPDRRVDIVTQRRAAPPKTITKRNIPLAIPAKTVEVKVVPVSPPFEPNKLEVGKTYAMDRIYFYSGRHKIREESKPELYRLYQSLVDNPTLVIRIEGHVCCVADTTDALDEDTFEQALSINRAKFIYQYLVEKGIGKERLSYIGFGRSRPIIKHELSGEDADRNRRVEIRVMDK
jgi:outer membrane protein OmpA-like peptidoglycan-associated protein